MDRAGRGLKVIWEMSAQKFRAVFGTWFSILEECESEFGKLKTGKPGVDYCLNVESIDRVTSGKGSPNSLPVALKRSEHDLECYIAAHPARLKACLGINKLHRQCPVGVFRGKKPSSVPTNEIFPHRHSAIDLWGVNRATNKLVLFELKKPRNIPLGILSEMLFYSFVMEDVQMKRFKFDKDDQEIADTTSIAMFILATKWHPLIDAKLLQLTNGAFRSNNRRIRLGAVKIGSKEDDYRLEIPACD